MADHADQASRVQKMLDLINDVKYAMLTTREVDGTLRSRPLTTLEAEFEGVLRFLVAADSDIARDLQGDPQANLGYADPRGNSYVSVSGTGTVRRDPTRAKALWNAWADSFFDGPDDPNVSVLEIDVQSAQYWSLPSGVLGRAVAYIKAAAGKLSDVAESETIEFRD